MSDEQFSYEGWVEKSKEGADELFHEARCGVYDSLTEAQMMLKSLGQSFTCADVVQVASMLQDRLFLLREDAGRGCNCEGEGEDWKQG